MLCRESLCISGILLQRWITKCLTFGCKISRRHHLPVTLEELTCNDIQRTEKLRLWQGALTREKLQGVHRPYCTVASLCRRSRSTGR